MAGVQALMNLAPWDILLQAYPEDRIMAGEMRVQPYATNSPPPDFNGLATRPGFLFPVTLASTAIATGVGLDGLIYTTDGLIDVGAVLAAVKMWQPLRHSMLATRISNLSNRLTK